MHGRRRRKSPIRHEPWAQPHEVGVEVDHKATAKDHEWALMKEDRNKYVVDDKESPLTHKPWAEEHKEKVAHSGTPEAHGFKRGNESKKTTTTTRKGNWKGGKW